MRYGNYKSNSKEISKVTDSYKFPGKKVAVEFTNGSYSLRNLYTYKKINDGVTVFRNDYKVYKIVKNAYGNYDFSEMTKEEKIKFNIKEETTKEDIEIMEEIIEEIIEDGFDPNARHAKYELIKTLVNSNIPIYLHGPAGSGKNYTIQKIAEELGLDFYFVNSIQESYKVTGFIDGYGKFHETEFYKAFTNGGLFFLDEMDASIPEVLILLNAAIANKYFSFPTGQVNAHPDFRCIAAGNTVGSGSDEMYTGRSVIDISSVDRFAIVEFDYDRNVEMSIAEGNKELVDFVRECRRISKTNGMRMVFSYRAIEMVTKMEKAMLDLKTILTIGVFKGMSADDINMFNIWSENKYSKALRGLQRA